MARRDSDLHVIIKTGGEAFAKALRQASVGGNTEADVRSAADRELSKIEALAGISLTSRHEFTVASGRIDSVYDRVIVEYKNPNSGSDKIGKTLASAGSAKLLKQIKSRFHDLEHDLGHPINSLFGVGLDGNRFIFVRYREGTWDEEEPVDVTAESATRFLWALFNLGQSGKPFTADYLARDFGSGSEAATELITAFYSAIKTNRSQKAETLYSEWQSLFGMVSGYDSIRSQEKIRKLAELYGITTASIDPPALLFAAHSYYAVFMKFLAAEIIAFFHKLPSPTQKILRAPTTTKFRAEIEDLERGSLFRHLNITNFLEGDLFSWYTASMTSEVEAGLRTLVRQLDEFNPGTLSEEPTRSQDLLKDLYLQIMPREVRHDLGEYYTPDWVAELLFQKLSYSGAPDERILDPACGSGTFIVAAINKIRRGYLLKREQMEFDESELLKSILTNVVGFDLNPLAVLAARTNYLIAVRDLLSYVDSIEIPIYMCDSVVTPAEYGDLFTGTSATAQVPCAANKPPFLLVPKEVGKNSSFVAQYAETIEHSLAVRLSAGEFLKQCKDRGLPIAKDELHLELFEVLKRLESEGKNGIWARIIKNAFAPLFAGKFDFIVGNPPWINWEHLPPEYREISSGIWEHYGLVGNIPVPKRQSSEQSKTDIAILMTYVVADKYAKDGAKVGFVLPRTIFQSELGGWHFRRFSIPGGKKIKVLRVDDIDQLKPFRGQATNTSCTVVFEVGKPTQYPVKWYRWQRNEGADVTLKTPIKEMLLNTSFNEWNATPVDLTQPQSPWLIGRPETLTILRKLIGQSFYHDLAREGVNTRGANGVFFVDAWLTNGKLFVKNRPSDGRNTKTAETTKSVEDLFLYPLLRGENVSQFSATPAHFIMLPHSAANPTSPVPFADIPRKTQEFLSIFRQLLKARIKFRNFDPSGRDWHGLYSVLHPTFAPHKVVWREMGAGIIAAAVGTAPLPNDEEKIVIPDHKLFLIPCESADEANFVAGVINSWIVNLIVASYAVSTGISAHILARVPLPRYQPKEPVHRQIAEIARAVRKRVKDNREHEDKLAELNAAVGVLLGVDKKTVAYAKTALQDFGIKG